MLTYLYRLIKLGILCVAVVSMTACSSEVTNRVGDTAYDFQVEDDEGEDVKVSDFQGQALYIIGWSTT